MTEDSKKRALSYKLVKAAARGRAGRVLRYLARGADVDWQTSRGESALACAVAIDNYDMVRCLLEADASPDLQGEDGNTPLHLAVLGDRPKIAAMLVAYGASDNIRNVHGKTVSRILAERESAARAREQESKSREAQAAEVREEESAWTARMFEEMSDDDGPFSGARSMEHENDNIYNDGWREHDWMEEIAQAMAEKKARAWRKDSSHRHSNSRSRKRRHHHSTDHHSDDSADRQHSERQRRRKTEENEHRDQERKAEQVTQGRVRDRTTYLSQWTTLTARVTAMKKAKTAATGGGDDAASILGLADIPWPIARDRHSRQPLRSSVLETKLEALTVDQVRSLLLAGVANSEWVATMKSERIRWHPDRFAQKHLPWVNEANRDKIATYVTKVSQLVNNICDDVIGSGGG